MHSIQPLGHSPHNVWAPRSSRACALSATYARINRIHIAIVYASGALGRFARRLRADSCNQIQLGERPNERRLAAMMRCNPVKCST